MRLSSPSGQPKQHSSWIQSGSTWQFLTANGGMILRPPQQVPAGINMTARHPDGLVIEYVEDRH
jgi:hypothetical protein